MSIRMGTTDVAKMMEAMEVAEVVVVVVENLVFLKTKTTKKMTMGSNH